MANNSSRLFTPPMDGLRDSDPQIVKVPLNSMDFASRSSQQKPWGSTWAGVKNLKNGQ